MILLVNVCFWKIIINPPPTPTKQNLKNDSLPPHPVKKDYMNQILTKEMAIDLVKGITIPYELFDKYDGKFTYSDQYGKFYWSDTWLKSLSIEELMEVYKDKQR
jgi:hypothetical protein